MEEQLLSLRRSTKSADGRANDGNGPVSSGTSLVRGAPAAASSGGSVGAPMPEQHVQRTQEALGLRNYVFRSLRPVSITKLSKADEPRSPAGMLPPDPSQG